MGSSATQTATGSQLADYGLVVLLAAIFGLSFSLTKIGLEGFGPVTLVAIRLVIAAAFFLVMMVRAGQKLPAMGSVWLFILASAFFGNVLPFSLISWGQEKVDAGLAAILMATMPLMTIMMAHFLTHDEKLNPFKIIGFVLGLVGVVYLIGLDKLAAFSGEGLREFSIILAACCYALNAIITKSLTGLPRRAMLAALMLVSAVLIVPAAFVFERPLEMHPQANAILATLALAILPTVIGTVMIFAIVKRQGASFLSQINFMVPVFGVLWSVVLVGEVPPARALIALAIILVGVAIARIKSPGNRYHTTSQSPNHINATRLPQRPEEPRK